MRTAVINCLVEQARIDDRIFLVNPDVGFSVLERFRDEFPDRYVNVGIAEQNAVGVAAGLALSGKIPYVYSMIPFVTMRCFEQVRLEVAYMNTNVRLIGLGAGLTYGAQGATHHAIEDIAIMRALPNMTVCCPGDPHEARELLRRSFSHQGPIYLRLGKNNEPVIHGEETPIEIGRAVWVAEGDDAVLITTSNTLGRRRQRSPGILDAGLQTRNVIKVVARVSDGKFELLDRGARLTGQEIIFAVGAVRFHPVAGLTGGTGQHFVECRFLWPLRTALSSSCRAWAG